MDFLEELRNVAIGIAVAITLGTVCVLLLRTVNNISEENDPNRDYYITRVNSKLQCGEIYEKVFTPEHIKTEKKSEMQWRYDYGYNPVTSNFGYHYGFHPTSVSHSITVPDSWLFKIKSTDEERLIYYVNEVKVCEYTYKKHSVGEHYAGGSS